MTAPLYRRTAMLLGSLSVLVALRVAADAQAPAAAKPTSSHAPAAKPTGAQALSAAKPSILPAPSATTPAAVTPSAPSAPAAAAPRKGEAELLVPPGGAAFDVPMHAGTVCILSFFEPLLSSALASSPDFEVRAWGTDGVAIRAIGSAKTMTLALATATRAVKINITFRLVPPEVDALTLVRFKAVTEQEAREAFVKAEVDRRMAPLRAELETAKKDLDAQVQDRAELLVMERSLKRSEVLPLRSIERSDANVIAHVKRAMVLGENGYLYFEVENRGSTPFRLARLEVTAAGKPVPGRVRLLSASVDKDPRMIGVIQAGTTARGVVAVRGVDAVMNKPLALELAGPQGRGAFRLAEGIAFK